MTKLYFFILCGFLLSWNAHAQVQKLHDLLPSQVTYVAEEKKPNPLLERALLNEEGSVPKSYSTNSFDLNQDGLPDILMYVTDRDWCGTGGCNLWIFKNLGKEYKLVGDLSPVRTPIIVSSHKTNGWHDVIFPISGGGGPSMYLKVTIINNQYGQDDNLGDEISYKKISGTGFFK